MSDRLDRPGFLFVLPWDVDQPGGVNEVVLNLQYQMAVQGRIRPVLLIGSWEHPRAVTKTAGGHTTIYWRMRPPWIAGSPARAALAFLAYFPSAVLNMRRLLSQHGIHAVNFHYVGISALLLVLMRRLGLFRGKVILSFHGADVRAAAKANGVERFLWRFLLRSADARVAVSNDLSHQVRTLCPRIEVVTIHNGLDLLRFFAERNPRDRIEARLEDHPFVLCVASFEYRKGHDILLRAFAGLTQQFPDLLLVLIGNSRPYVSEVAEEIARLSLRDRVILLKDMPHGHVLPYFEKARLFVLPSREEPFGLVLLEAGTYALPVIATAVGGIPEIITDNAHGRLVPPDDIAALGRAMTDLLNDPREAARLGQGLRRRVTDDFVWTTAYDAYVRLAGLANSS